MGRTFNNWLVVLCRGVSVGGGGSGAIVVCLGMGIGDGGTVVDQVS